MAAPRWKQTPPLKVQLFQEGHEFEFHQAVKIAEQIYRPAESLGCSSFPDQEALILKSRILFAYPSSDIYKISYEHLLSQEKSKIIIQINFFGLAGANGPLPLPYTEKIFEGLKSRKRGTSDFLDIFNHRLLSILHRIRTKHWIGLDSGAPDKTVMGQMMYSFTGITTTAHMQNRLSYPDKYLLFYAGLFWQNPKSSMGLATLLQHFFNCPIKIKPFYGGWEKIEFSQVTKIGKQGQHQILGKSAAMGDKVWNACHRIRICIGPLSYKQYKDFQPDGIYFNHLKDLVYFYLGRVQEFDLNFILYTSSLKGSSLKSQTKLGWNSWIGLRLGQQEQDDQVIIRV